MKRKQFRDRIQVLISVERDRWSEFVDQCDKEHKSSSLKIDEMLVGELQKNQPGAESGPMLHPLANIIRHKTTNKRFQANRPELPLEVYMRQVIQSAKEDLKGLQEIERVNRMTKVEIEPLIKRARMYKMINDRFNDGSTR